MSIDKSEGPEIVYVFGCFSLEGGHYIHNRMGWRMPRDVPVDVAAACDGSLAPRDRQTEGEVARSDLPIAGWSYVSWYDRKGDPRTGSHTGILARGEWTHEQLITAGRRLAPWAFRVPLLFEAKP